MLSQKETNLPTIDYQGRTVSFEKARWWQLKYSLNFHPYLQKMSILTILQGTNISPKNGMFEDDFPFPKVGYVNPLEGNIFQRGWFNHQPEWSILCPSFRLAATGRGGVATPRTPGNPSASEPTESVIETRASTDSSAKKKHKGDKNNTLEDSHFA